MSSKLDENTSYDSKISISPEKEDSKQSNNSSITILYEVKNITSEDNIIDEKSKYHVTMKQRICKKHNDNIISVCKNLLPKII